MAIRNKSNPAKDSRVPERFELRQFEWVVCVEFVSGVAAWKPAIGVKGPFAGFECLPRGSCDMSRKADVDRVWDIIEKVGVCMLTTRFPGGLRARPLEARPDREAGLIFS